MKNTIPQSSINAKNGYSRKSFITCERKNNRLPEQTQLPIHVVTIVKKGELLIEDSIEVLKKLVKTLENGEVKGTIDLSHHQPQQSSTASSDAMEEYGIIHSTIEIKEEPLG